MAPTDRYLRASIHATPPNALGARSDRSFDRAVALADSLHDDDIETKRDLNK